MIDQILRPIARYIPVVGDYLYVKFSLKEWIGSARNTPLGSEYFGYEGDELDEKLKRKAEGIWVEEIDKWLKEQDLSYTMGLEGLKEDAIEKMKTAMKLKLEDQRQSR